MSRYFLAKWAVDRIGKKCSIINYSSVVAKTPRANLAIYGATKSFNSNFSESLNLEYL